MTVYEQTAAAAAEICKGRICSRKHPCGGLLHERGRRLEDRHKLQRRNGGEIARALLDVTESRGIFLAVQCCEHLNRAIIIERAAVPGAEIVNVVPQPKAGGSLATQVYAALKEPVALEEIKADAGLDIGLTLIGMHLKKGRGAACGKTTIGAAMVVARAHQIHRRRESRVRRPCCDDSADRQESKKEEPRLFSLFVCMRKLFFVVLFGMNFGVRFRLLGRFLFRERCRLGRPDRRPFQNARRPSRKRPRSAAVRTRRVSSSLITLTMLPSSLTTSTLQPKPTVARMLASSTHCWRRRPPQRRRRCRRSRGC